MTKALFIREDCMMFILLGSIAALIISAIQIFAFCENRSFGKCLHFTIRNIFVINLVSLALLKYVFKYQHFLVTNAYKTASFVKFFFLSVLVGIVFLFISAIVNNFIAFENETPKKSGGARFMKILSAIFVALGSACYFGTIWGKGAFGDVTADQLLINLTSPTEGMDPNVYLEGFEGPVFQTMLVTTLFCIFAFSNFKIVYNKNRRATTIFNDLAHRIISLLLAVAFLAGGIIYGVEKFQLVQLYNAYILESNIIDDNYADPRTTKMTFPEKKRNLIHIYLESLENSFLSKDLGGYIDENLMPELTELSYEGITFSDNENKFGGPLQATGTQWSVASMVNMTTGLPMKVPAEPNAYGSKDNFLPGAWTMGDILKEQGYEQTVMFGADANFGGLTYYYESHGNYKIMDHRFAKKNGLVPEDYKVWWGYEDDKLYEFAKDELTRLYETGKPFNFTMETADTHRPGGYLSDKAPQPHKDHYANAISYSTSETVKFVRWIQEQPFYENTTIILIGDHLSMDTDFFINYNFDDSYLRTQYNLIINPDPSVANISGSRLVNRQYANFDMFPTILASIGVDIKGERLGIGTNLFSGKKTIFEEYGVDAANRELEKKSDIYNNTILVDPNKPLPDATTENQ